MSFFPLSVLADVILTSCYHQPDKSNTCQLTPKICISFDFWVNCSFNTSCLQSFRKRKLCVTWEYPCSCAHKGTESPTCWCTLRWACSHTSDIWSSWRATVAPAPAETGPVWSPRHSRRSLEETRGETGHLSSLLAQRRESHTVLARWSYQNQVTGLPGAAGHLLCVCAWVCVCVCVCVYGCREWGHVLQHSAGGQHKSPGVFSFTWRSDMPDESQRLRWFVLIKCQRAKDRGHRWSWLWPEGRRS